MTESSLKVLDKVKKLLALSSSANESESAAASQKAHELLREHNLTAADIPSEKSTNSRLLDEDFHRVRKWRAILLIGIARANYCAVLTELFRGMSRYRLYGRDYNIAATVAIYEYLLEAINRISRKVNIANNNKNSFRVGMVYRLLERIEEENAAEEGCTALVLSKRDADKALRHENPKVKPRDISADADELSAALGARAAEDIPLNRQMRGDSLPRAALA